MFSQRSRLLIALTAFLALAAPAAEAADSNFATDADALQTALTALRAKLGDHPRVLKIDVQPDEVAIQAQDRDNPRHVDEWRYSELNLVLFTHASVRGPDPVSLDLLDPDLEANLFDLDSVRFDAAAGLEATALKRASFEDPGQVTSMDIARHISILPNPKAGDVWWSVHLSSGREQADVYADPKGEIFAADLSQTRRAQTVSFFQEPDLIAQGVGAFRAALGAAPILTKVRIAAQEVDFATTAPDKTMANLMPGMAATASYYWDLSGMKQRLVGQVVMPTLPDAPRQFTFGVDDVDWSVAAKFQAEALKRAAAPGGRISELSVAKVEPTLGDPAIAWTAEIKEDSGEETVVTGDRAGAVVSVLLPESRRPKIDWREPDKLAGALKRVGAQFGAAARISSIAVDEDGGKITIAEAPGKPAASYEFEGDGLKRSGMILDFNPKGPSFGVADLAKLDAAILGKLEAQTLKTIGTNPSMYLQEVRIGAEMFNPQLGARAITVTLMNTPKNSAQSEYARMVYSFDGKVVDTVGP